MAKVAVDTNLLLLLVAGRVSPDLVGRYKRLRAFTTSDYELFVSLIAGADQIVVTPHILTETSNLIGQMPDPASRIMRAALRKLAERAKEHSDASIELMGHACFPSLGLTDAGILSLPFADCVVWTTDTELWAACQKQGKRAQNFNHHREARGTV